MNGASLALALLVCELHGGNAFIVSVSRLGMRSARPGALAQSERGRDCPATQLGLSMSSVRRQGGSQVIRVWTSDHVFLFSCMQYQWDGPLNMAFAHTRIVARRCRCRQMTARQQSSPNLACSTHFTSKCGVKTNASKHI